MICLATPKKIEKCFDHYFTRIWPCLFFWGTISIFQPQQVLRMHFGTPLCSVENWMDLTWFHQGNDRHNQSHPSIPTGSHGIVNNSWPGHNCGSQLFFCFFQGMLTGWYLPWIRKLTISILDWTWTWTQSGMCPPKLTHSEGSSEMDLFWRVPKFPCWCHNLLNS